jgi:hypothetical protein
MEKKNKIQKIEKENNNLAYEKLESQLADLLAGQEIGRKEQKKILDTVHLGFIGLAKHNIVLYEKNQELVELNKQSTQQLENLQLVQSNDLFGEKIKQENIKSIQNVEKNLRDIICSSSEIDQKIAEIAELHKIRMKLKSL